MAKTRRGGVGLGRDRADPQRGPHRAVGAAAHRRVLGGGDGARRHPSAVLTSGTITPAAPASSALPIAVGSLASTRTMPTAVRAGVDRHEPVQHARVAEQSVLRVESHVVVAEPGDALGGDGGVEDRPSSRSPARGRGACGRIRWRSEVMICSAFSRGGWSRRSAVVGGHRAAEAGSRPRRTRPRRRRAADPGGGGDVGLQLLDLGSAEQHRVDAVAVSSQRRDSSARPMPASSAMRRGRSTASKSCCVPVPLGCTWRRVVESPNRPSAGLRRSCACR